jgi:hypothetical protein
VNRPIKIIIVLFSLAFFVSGCEWMGKMSVKAEKGIGKGVQKMEKAVDKMDKKFEEGREEEEGK